MSISTMRAIWLALCTILLALATWRSVPRDGEEEHRALESASLFFLLGFLASPDSWVVHYVAVLLPMACVLRRAVAESWWYRAVWGLSFFAMTASGWSRPTVRLSIEQSWFVMSAVLLFFVLALPWRKKKEARSPA